MSEIFLDIVEKNSLEENEGSVKALSYRIPVSDLDDAQTKWDRKKREYRNKNYIAKYHVCNHESENTPCRITVIEEKNNEIVVGISP